MFGNEAQPSEELLCLEALTQLPRKSTERVVLCFPALAYAATLLKLPNFSPLTMYTACIRTVHCFNFLSALRWLKMHNYHQFAAILWKVPKLSLGSKLQLPQACFCCSMPLIPVRTLLFPNGTFHLYFVSPRNELFVCFFGLFWIASKG